MKSIPKFKFHKTKYGDELLIDVVELRSIEKYIQRAPIQRLTYYDITLITEGKGEFILNDRVYPVETNDIVCSAPGEIRGWKKDGSFNGLALIFEAEFLLSFFSDLHFLESLAYFHPERKNAKISVTSDYTGYFRQIKTEVEKYNPKDSHILRSLLYHILVLLNRAYFQTVDSQPEPSHRTNRYVSDFIHEVQENFMYSKDVRHYADRLCITANYLNEIIQEALGINAKSYIQNRVMQEAKRLLGYTTLSLTEISEQLSYSSPSYFARVFHKHTGVTPLQYRKRNKP